MRHGHSHARSADLLRDLCSLVRAETIGLGFLVDRIDLPVCKFLDVALVAKGLDDADWQDVVARAQQYDPAPTTCYALHFTDVLYPGFIPAAVIDTLAAAGHRPSRHIRIRGRAYCALDHRVSPPTIRLNAAVGHRGSTGWYDRMPRWRAFLATGQPDTTGLSTGRRTVDQTTPKAPVSEAHVLTLTVLGAGAPYAQPDRSCSGYLLRAGHHSLWVDAGPGTLAALQRFVTLESLSAVWLSHLHAGHAADLLGT